MKIRIYNSGDSIKVKKLFCEFVKYHETLYSNFKKVDNHGDIFLESIEKNLKNLDYSCCVAELDGEIKGYCVADMVEHLSREKPIHTNKLGSTISIKRLDRGGVRNNDG